MTVCIAALGLILDGSGQVMAVTACDRMLSTGDGADSFEPKAQTAKYSVLPNKKSALMMAGDITLQNEIALNVYNEILSKENNESILITEIVDIYIEKYNQIRLKRIESLLLAPFGLTSQSFISRQKEMSSDFIEKLQSEMIFFQMPSIEAIVVGSDTTGTHIWEISNGEKGCIGTCHDNIGFAAIGSGGRNAKSHFMVARYAFTRPITDGLVHAYIAKKRAEVSLGVGIETDLSLIGSGGIIYFPKEALEKLEATYNDIHKQELTKLTQAEKDMLAYVKQVQQTPDTSTINKN